MLYSFNLIDFENREYEIENALVLFHRTGENCREGCGFRFQYGNKGCVCTPPGVFLGPGNRSDNMHDLHRWRRGWLISSKSGRLKQVFIRKSKVGLTGIFDKSQV